MSAFIQNTYEKNIGKAYAGMIADGCYKFVESRTAARNIVYGTALLVGTEAGQDPERHAIMSTGIATAQIFRGVAVREQIREGQLTPLVMPESSNGETFYVPAEQTVGVLVKGRIWVKVEEDVNAFSQAYYKASKGGVSGEGTWFQTSNMGNNSAVPNGTYVTAAVAGELALLEIL